MRQNLKAVSIDLQAMANNMLRATGYAGTKYPWLVIKGIHVDYADAKAKGDQREAEQLALLINTLRTWYDALQNLGNTVVPSDVAEYPWHTED